MRMIDHTFPWTEKSSWAWTDDDVKLLQVIDDVNDVERIVRDNVDTAADSDGNKTLGRRTAIQAGAACGVWAFRLSQGLFAKVITLEPLPDNFECAAWNLAGIQNIKLINGALGSGAEGGSVFMKQHPNERQNAGSQQVDFHDGPVRVPIFRIDDIAQGEDVDFIALDLEGYELPALHGAVQTLERCRPVIMVEDKGLSTKFGVSQGEVVKWLVEEQGYRIGVKIKRDVVMVPR